VYGPRADWCPGFNRLAHASGLGLVVGEHAQAIMNMRDSGRVKIISSSSAVVELQPVGYQFSELGRIGAAVYLGRMLTAMPTGLWFAGRSARPMAGPRVSSIHA